jgi:hypothetical protein
MVVPEGRWIVRPEAPGLESSDPPSVELHLRAGDQERIDFVVDGDSRGGGKWTRVRVRDHRRKRVGEAIVEVWPPDQDMREDAPVSEARTNEWTDATLTGLADAEYLFVAGKRGYVEAGKVSEVPSADKGPIDLRLGQGATVHAVAADADGEAVAEVEVVLERVDDFVSLLADHEVAEWAARPTATTDGTGHLWVRGVYPGSYRMTGTYSSNETTMFFAEFRDKDDTRWQRELEKEYRGAEIDEIEIRLVAAGVLQATLHCSDGSELPPEADLLVLNGLTAHDPDRLAEEAIHQTQSYVLEGERRDGFHVGPLDAGAYHLLVRPQEHNRWTWALGTETQEDATVLTVAAGEPTALGAIAIDCAPAIAVRPIAPEGVELPDLVVTGSYEPLAELDGMLLGEDEPRALKRGRLIAEPSRVQFRDLPEGPVDLTLTLHNPLFLPGPSLTVPIQATLERGTTLERAPRLAGIGGAIVARLPDSPAFAAVLVERIEDPPDPQAEPWIIEIEGRSVLIPSLVPGLYRVLACADTACEELTDLWKPVDVPAGVITEASRLDVEPSE